MSSQLMINPDIPEAHQLRGWFDTVGHRETYEEYRSEGGAASGSGTNWKTFAQMKAETNQVAEKPEYFTTKATVVFVKKDNALYQV